MGGLDVECGYVQEKKKDILDFNDMIKEKVPTEVLGLRLMHQCLSLLHKATWKLKNYSLAKENQPNFIFGGSMFFSELQYK